MNKRMAFFALAMASLALGFYILMLGSEPGLGFPLDDAWIHQTYARNLAQAMEWSFIRGTPSGGSTAPLWSALLAPAHLRGGSPFVWTFAVGSLLLAGLGLVGRWAMGVFVPERSHWALAGLLLLVFEWHFVWAAGSGMETLLMALVTCLVLVWIVARPGDYLRKGLLIGLSVWIRPDGLTLLGPLLFSAWFAEPAGKVKLRSLLQVSAGFVLMFVPYLLFNMAVAGQAWPNTFFAKQAEYVALRELFLGRRLVEQALLPMVGVGIVLLPGMLLFGLRQIRARNWPVIAGFIWFAGNLTMYAIRLPVTYQHGRYLIPSMPILFLWGLAGLAEVSRPRNRQLALRVISRAWPMIAIVTLILFWIQGALAFRSDVGVINSAMVATAQWLDQNVDAQSLVAAHDIGALGYFAQRDLMDMAGLVSPEVIPFIRDEQALGKYLDNRQADYFVTLEGWYPALESGLLVEFRTDQDHIRDFGAVMVVYRWR